ncbi:MAG: hypothetical protein WA004_15015 [Saprospiraceae bacterium]
MKVLKLIPLALLFLAFQEPLLTELVRQNVAERVEEFRREQRALCRKRALEAASKEVDSLIIEWAKANRDTFGRPPRPEKPLLPEPLAPKDSTAVKPLFNGTQPPPADTTLR